MPFIIYMSVSVVAVDDYNNTTNGNISKYEMDYLYGAETRTVILS